jgi:hypothetical protein
MEPGNTFRQHPLTVEDGSDEPAIAAWRVAIPLILTKARQWDFPHAQLDLFRLYGKLSSLVLNYAAY